MSTQSNSGDGFPPDLLLELPSGGGRGVRERLEHALRVAIQEERLRGGAVLPASRVLAADLGVARTVVVEAYRNLAANGYLETRRGGWTRVRPYAPAEPARDEPPPGYEEQLFFGWRRPTSRVRIRLLGGLPDPLLFPRREWLRHYRAALDDLPPAALGYPDILGAEQLRSALADYLGRARGAVAAPERIVVCGGFTQGLTLVCRALRRLGACRVAVEEPCHLWHRTAVAAAGLEPVPVRIDRHGLDPASLPADVDAVVTAPAHSYPTGCTLHGDRRRALAAWAARTGALVVEDDYDAELRYDRAPIGTLQGLAPDQVIYIGSASKTLTPALRLGWLIAPSRLVKPLAREKHHDDMGSSLLEQLALARLVGSGSYARHLRRTRPVYRDRRDAAIKALETFLPGARWQGEAAGLHLFVTFPEAVDVHAVAAAAYERNILVEVGAWHWAVPDQAPPSLVLGYGGVSELHIRRGICVLAEAVGQVQQTGQEADPKGKAGRESRM